VKLGKGLRRDSADHPWRKKQRDARHLLGGSSHIGVKRAPGTAFLLRAFEGPKFDQLGCEGCTMHSFSSGLTIVTNFVSTPLGFVASPLDGYVGARCIGRAGAVDVPLADDGAMLADLATYVSRFGVRPIGALNPRGFTDVTTGPGGNVNIEPNLPALEEDAQALIVGEYRLDLAALTIVDDLCALIDKGIPPWFGGPVGARFEGYRAGDPACPAEPTGDGHATVGTGYFVNDDGSVDFDILSSWSATFGDDGHARVSSAWVLSQWDAYALTVRRAA
jgi:hypothetical protein